MILRTLVALALVPALVAGPALAQTVVIVRHAEKASPDGDPDLSAAGQARAQDLAAALAGDKPDIVLATPLKRTQQTAAPAAQAAGVAVQPVGFEGGGKAHAERVAAEARKAPADATVLVVGHSNTVADIAKALGDADAKAPTDCEYDQMTVITLDGAKPPKVLRKRYGVATAACAS